MYLSPDWSEERYGETIFVEKTKNGRRKTQNSGNEKYNTLGISFCSNIFDCIERISYFSTNISVNHEENGRSFFSLHTHVSVDNHPEYCVYKAQTESAI